MRPGGPRDLNDAMTISIQFTKKAAFSETDQEVNKKVINETINKFGDESVILKRQNLLIYFGWKGKYAIGFDTYGFLIIKGKPGYKDFKIKFQDEINDIDNFGFFKYIIYLASDIGHCKNKIFKNFTIVHELQHILQDIYLKNINKKNSVLFRYYRLKKFNTNELPKEYDAFRKAKLINYKIYGKKEIDNFLSSKKDKYWENIKAIDVCKNYDLKDEIESYWKDHKEDIKEERERIEIKKQNSILEEKEKAFLDAYEYYLKCCK